MSNIPDAIRISVHQGNLRSFRADVVALSKAQAFFGRGTIDLEQLGVTATTLGNRLKIESEVFLAHSRGAVGAAAILFVSLDFAEMLEGGGYKSIRQFARRVLTSLAVHAPGAQTLALTAQGQAMGLDEVEAFEATVAGLVDAVAAGESAPSLHQITIVELVESRARRFEIVLARLLPDGAIPIPGRNSPVAIGPAARETLRSAGYASASKAHVFVAMPFSEDMEDVYHYGIQGAVRQAGFLCERADVSSFTGEIIAWVRERIGSCTLVIAELSRPNPNVYLEVGYAWGSGRPTILLARDPGALSFDVKGHRCLFYKTIKELEQLLGNELMNLNCP